MYSIILLKYQSFRFQEQILCKYKGRYNINKCIVQLYSLQVIQDIKESPRYFISFLSI